ncbi:MAG: glycosyltransferase [Acidisphaera sp.]|nr:glycosyltransferase [Acidisphaera sp.]
MASLVSFPVVDYRDPWNESRDARLAALSRGHRRVAYFYEKPDTSTFRYRVHNMIDALRADPQTDISATWFALADLEDMDAFVDRTDVLVICRTRYSAPVGRMIARARARGLRLIFDIDDLVFDPNYVHVILDTLDQDVERMAIWDDWHAYVGRLAATLRHCDEAIVTTAPLAERMAACLPGGRVHIIPNYLNRAQIELSRSLFEARRELGFADDGRIHLGYFSGSPTHNRDFAVAASALARLLREERRLMIRVVGFLDLPEALQRHRDRFEMVELQDFLNLQRLIGETDVNLVPLRDDVFTRCKSELKFFEAAIVGTPTIASPTPAFAGAIEDGVNGFLAREQDWYPKLRQLLERIATPAGRIELAERALRDVEERYAWTRQGPAIEAALFASDASCGDRRSA